MKKISSILIIIILFNFIFSNYIFAVDVSDDSAITYSEDEFDQLVNNGTVNIDGETQEVSDSKSSAASAIGTETATLSPILLVVATAIRDLVNEGGFYHTESNYSASEIGWFTVNSLVFGEYLLFNANIFQTNKSLNPDIEPTGISNTMDSLKEWVAIIFQVMYLVSMALIIILLIYSVLRLMVSDLAEDRARYKKVIKAWATGLLFIFTLPLIISTINVLSDYLVNMFWNFRLSLEESGYVSFESELLIQCIYGTAETGGLQSAAYFIEFLLFMIIQIKFIIKYFARSFMSFIYVCMAPYYGIAHVASTIKGGEGRIGEWLYKYGTRIFIQPLHAFLYLVIMFVVGNLIKAPLLAVVFLWAISHAEDIFKVIFRK